MSKKHDPFVSLLRKPDSMAMPMVGGEKKEPPRGPTVYIHDTEKLPVGEEDIGKVLTVEAKIIVTSIGQDSIKGKTRHKYDVELRAIRFLS